mmetsp:Transcript_8724/g.27817  ORF Transcript_8724/g.27817 Transcript_8724/m.27817 type:complete len:374 (-) Transcript_8724:2142-3263(-)
MNKFNKGQQLRWPLTDMTISPFVRPELGEDDDVTLAHQLRRQQEFGVSLADEGAVAKALRHLVSPDYRTRRDDSVLNLSTHHADALFLGSCRNRRNGKLERYLLKAFPVDSEEALGGAAREVLFSYALVELGEALHAPKISLVHLTEDRVPCVVRRFYRGFDGRAAQDDEVTSESEETWRALELRAESLVRMFALRYVLLGDADAENPGNVLFTRHSNLTSKVILLIDGEDIIPNRHIAMRLTASETGPIPGTREWRQFLVERHGGAARLARDIMSASQNPLLVLTRRLCNNDIDLALQTPVARSTLQRVVAARPHLEALARSFNIVPLEELEEGTLDFQRTCDVWQQVLENSDPLDAHPLTLEQLLTATELA